MVSDLICFLPMRRPMSVKVVDMILFNIQLSFPKWIRKKKIKRMISNDGGLVLSGIYENVDILRND